MFLSDLPANHNLTVEFASFFGGGGVCSMLLIMQLKSVILSEPYRCDIAVCFAM